MANCLSKFSDKPFTLQTPPLTAGHLKKMTSGIQKNPVKYFASAYIETMGMKILHKVLKVALRMYMIDFLHNHVRPHTLKKGVSKIFYIILNG